jgi:hypothetical protein
MKSLINYLSSKYFFRGRAKKNKHIDDFWIQKLNIKRIHDREIVFKPFLENKNVLHVGCTDYPIFNPQNNLHLKISKYTNILHGMDVDRDGIDVLNDHFKGTYFTEIRQSYGNIYDTVLVPETIEHVENIGVFLNEISAINAKNFIITGPNAFNSYYQNKVEKESELYKEIIHPDHNCWFSPYTLKNVIEKYSSLCVNEIYLCNFDLMVVCICSKK